MDFQARKKELLTRLDHQWHMVGYALAFLGAFVFCLGAAAGAAVALAVTWR